MPTIGPPRLIRRPKKPWRCPLCRKNEPPGVPCWRVFGVHDETGKPGTVRIHLTCLPAPPPAKAKPRRVAKAGRRDLDPASGP